MPLLSGLGSGIVVAGSGGVGETSGAFGVGNVDVVEMGVVEWVGGRRVMLCDWHAWGGAARVGMGEMGVAGRGVGCEW